MVKTLSDPIIHPVTKSLLQEVLEQPPNSLGLMGTSGIGRKTIAQWLIRKITNNPKIDLGDSQFTKLIVSENNISIKIEQIHEINNFVKLKTAGTNDHRRFVVIDNADLLTDDAQNALLSLLEEPPLDTMIILTIENPENILPTVLSRIQTISIKKPTRDQLKGQFGIETKDFDRLYALTDGLPGLLQSIQDDPDNHPLTVALEKARDLLAKKTYDRLISINELTSDKNETKILLDVLVRLSKVSINTSVNKSDQLSADKWLKILSASVDAREALRLNANPKLTLTDLFLNLV